MTAKGRPRNFLGWGGKFYILIVVVVSPLYTLVKNHQTVHLKRVNVTACKLCLDNPDFLKKLRSLK